MIRISKKSSSNQCPICKNKKESSLKQYCKDHNNAKVKLKNGYELWLKAYGSISWDDFLQNLQKLEGLVGNFVREVAEYEFYFQ